jgi:hypothetical protein
MMPPVGLPVPIAAAATRDLSSVDLSSTRAAIARVVSDPTSNTTLALLLLVGVTLAVLLLISAVLAVAMPSRKRVVKVRRYSGTPEEIAAVKAGAAERAARAQQAPSPRQGAPSAARKPLISTPILIGLGVLLVVSMYAATSTDAYCAKTCHKGSAATASAEKAGHASCTSCHEGHVVTGFVGNSISRLRMVAMQTMAKQAGSAEIPVDSRACLRCHRSVRRGVTVSAAGTKMSHAEVIAAGQPCTQCHTRMGHRKQAYTQAMSGCITCHDTRTASAECVTCHSKDPLLAAVSNESTETIGSGTVIYPAVRAANRNCGGCHDLKKSCDPCHGIRMPHSPEFKAGGHAINAAFEAKTKCWRCHDPQVCAQGCHSSFGSDGASAHGKPAKWRVEHQASSWDAGCECHRTRSNRKYPICYRCHDPKTKALLPTKP